MGEVGAGDRLVMAGLVILGLLTVVAGMASPRRELPTKRRPIRSTARWWLRPAYSAGVWPTARRKAEFVGALQKQV